MTENRAATTGAMLLGAALLAGCASSGDIKSSIKDGITTVGSTIQTGVDKITGGSAGSGNGQRILSSNRTLEIAAQFPSDQVPHTLMKKPVADGRLTSGFGYRLSPTGIRLPKKHKGVDYAADAGTPIYAAGDGVITRLYISKSYGNYIRIRHDNGFETAYAHMQAFVEGLDEGSTVSQGQQIGAVGNTGRSTAAHLHFELIYNGDFIDPLLGAADSTVAMAN